MFQLNFKNTICVCEIWGNFMKNWYFTNNCLIKVQISKSFCTNATDITAVKHRSPPFVLLIYLKRIFHQRNSANVDKLFIKTTHVPNMSSSLIYSFTLDKFFISTAYLPVTSSSSKPLISTSYLYTWKEFFINIIHLH